MRVRRPVARERYSIRTTPVASFLHIALLLQQIESGRVTNLQQKKTISTVASL